MSDTVKLIIDIPVRILDTIQADQMISREQLAVLQTHIQNGVPLDDVKAEIEQIKSHSARFRTSDGTVVYVDSHNVLEVLDNILDNIGKESKE